MIEEHIAKALGYIATRRTRLWVYFGEGSEHSGTTRRLGSYMSFEEAQRGYVKYCDENALGASQMGAGLVYDEKGQYLARISYNGKLWTAHEGKFVASAPEIRAPETSRFDNEHRAWVQGRFIDGKEHAHMSDEEKARNDAEERRKVRTAPKANAICIATDPEAAEWIAHRLNRAAQLERELEHVKELLIRALGK